VRERKGKSTEEEGRKGLMALDPAVEERREKEVNGNGRVRERKGKSTEEEGRKGLRALDPAVEEGIEKGEGTEARGA